MLKRRTFLKQGGISLGVGLTAPIGWLSSCKPQSAGDALHLPAAAGLTRPQAMYINWAAYDELSDKVRLDEALAMKQMQEVIRLKALGVQLDYYMMDAFWFDPDGGYREWRKGSWPDGPQQWLDACEKHDVKPGLWVSTNWMVAGDGYKFLNVIPEWADSATTKGQSFCLFEGGYLPHLIETLKLHARNGIKAFKFDFADFGAVTPEWEDKLSKKEIQEKNESALIEGLKSVRAEFPDLVFMAYNGYGGQYNNTYEAFQKSVDEKWLEVFDTLYCGDPRLADVPTYSFWRSKDIYSDHMVQNYLQNGIPRARIDNSAFMIGTTGTCYYRYKQAWEGMLLLSLARGGYLNTYYGNLDLLTDEEAAWFAKAQQLFYPLQEHAVFALIGGVPGNAEVYGYEYANAEGKLLTLVNPKQSFESFALPTHTSRMLLFADAGYTPALDETRIVIGPGQMAIIGLDAYASDRYQLGRAASIQIPTSIEPVELAFTQESKQVLSASWRPEEKTPLRLIFQQYQALGTPYRSSGGSPPHGTKLDKMLKIEVWQGGKEIPLQLHYDKAIWSGLSWASAEIRAEDYQVGERLAITFRALDERVGELDAFILKGDMYKLKYAAS